MGKIFFPVSGVDFSELRQIALTFCHSFVNRLRLVFSIGYASFCRPVIMRFVTGNALFFHLFTPKISI
jgi:hypothetical protein